MKMHSFAGVVALLGVTTLPIMARQSNDVVQSSPVVITHHGRVPVFHVEVVARNITAINYRVRGDETKIGFRGTPLEPLAHGHAEVHMSNGATHIEARFHKMVPATQFGPAFTTYVLWAITPAGRPVNLGEVELRGKHARLNVTSNLQSFGLIVTAEPYFAVTRPSNLVVLENFMRPNTRGEAGQIKARYLLLRRRDYTLWAPQSELTAIPMTHKVPLDYYEAQNALRIARWTEAPQYAPGAWRQAEAKYRQAQLYMERHAGRKPIAMMARAAAQAAEDARLLSLKRQANLRSQQRQQAMLRAKAEARHAVRRRAEAEASAVAAQASAEQARQTATQARLEAQQQQAQALAARQQTLAAQQQTAAAQQQIAAAQQQQAAMKARLERQLNMILATRSTAEGLIVNMPNLLFATNSYQLRTPAQIKLAKVSGVLAAYPGLQVTVNGYTDSTGTPNYNLQLSQERAEAVRSFLVAQGVSPSSITAMGYGESNPITSNNTAEGRQQNRRVELVVSGAAIGTPAPAGH